MAETKGYVFVSRKLVITWLSTTIALFLLFGFSIQFTFYTAQQWCGIVKLFDDTYKVAPPTSETGKILATEMSKLRRSYRCK